jgi:ATP-binding cassette subfamily B protein
VKRLLVPEVVQTSAMDCGPACLASLLEGFGVHASYGRLREACQTGVDGTSIDTLEDILVSLGLDAEQVMLPVDHVLLPESEALPALVVVRQPSGFTHFVIVWRIHGPLVQVMDPGTGRRWLTRERLLRDLYVHETDVGAEDAREWLASSEFEGPLRRRMGTIGLDAAAQARLLEAAAGSPPDGRLALDAAVRLAASLVSGSLVNAGSEAERFVAATLAEPDSLPPSYFTARKGEAADQLTLRGAVLVRIRGLRTERAPDAPPLTPELSRALQEPPARPLRELARLVRQGGWLTPGLLVTATALAAAGTALEALLFRAALDVPRLLATVQQRLVAVALLFVFAFAVRSLAVPAGSGSLRVGRLVEIRLRKAFLEKLTRLGDRYFQSRPISDMAERAHAVQAARGLPELGARLLRAMLDLLVTTAAIVWVDPRSAPIAVAACAMALLLPHLWQPALVERDLRARTHGGALARLCLDALLGLMPVRTHAAEQPMRREYEGLLVEWARATRRLLATAAWADVTQSLLVMSAVAWMLVRYVARAPDTSGVILLAYWGLSLPTLGDEVGLALRQFPGQRNVTLRLLEPLGAIEETATPSGAPPLIGSGAGVHVTMTDVGVVAGGHTILDGLNLEVKPGEKVGIVGVSGAGKSSLVGLLLGWHRPSSGAVCVDGQPLDVDRLEELRKVTAWVDPAVQVWNRPLLENLCYGAGADAPGRLAEVLEGADVHPLLARLPEGMQTVLGEGGTLVSGGEGQRVRLGRAMMRGQARLVVLDEPFRGLDRDKRRHLLARALAWWGKATILCVTHDVAETREFDRVLVIEGGRIVEDGPPAALAADPASRYAAMLDAEVSLLNTLWGGAEWRRVRMEAGHLRDEGKST